MRQLTLSVFLIASFLNARPLTLEEKRTELRSLATLIRSQYGPYEYKQTKQKLDFEKLVADYELQLVQESNVGYYYLINKFIAEFNDSHFSSAVSTDAVASLGFITDLVEDKVLIDEIDHAVLPESKFPFQKGDEIVSLGGTPAALLVTELSKYRGMGNPESARRIAAMAVSTRSAAVFPIPSGKVKVEIRKGTSGVTDTVELDWNVTGTPVWDDRKTAVGTDYGMVSISDIDATLPRSEKGFRCNGKTRIELPKDAKMIMEKPFVAYYWPTEKGNLGYLRIPHYYWKNDATGASENDIRFLQYEYAISELEKNTVGLIIDQDHNCGGSVALVEKMVGLFAEKPYLGMEFQFLATRTEYMEFSEWMNKDTKLTLEGKYLQEVLDLMKATWEKNGGRLTPKTTFQNNHLLTPNAVRYSKPVLMLIDEMSGSGGDAFPAVMQGIGRAKLFGARTMGAGGHVIDGIKLPYSGNSLRMTKSLFFHPNGTPIENNGASPDISYKPTRNDFMYGYREYRAKYTEALLSILK